jgi:ActR/RegA family two-component response regulator
MAAHIVNHGDVESSPMRSDFPEHKTILCIDDDGGMLGYQKALLERRGYKVLTADSARQGLQISF